MNDEVSSEPSSLAVPVCIVLDVIGPDLAKPGDTDRHSVDLSAVGDIDSAVPGWEECSGVDGNTSGVEKEAGRAGRLAQPSSIYRCASNGCLAHGGLGVGWGCTHSSEAKRDTLREGLNRARSGDHASRLSEVIKITSGLPAVKVLIPHINVESIVVARASTGKRAADIQIDVNPSIGKVSGSLQLGLIDGSIQISGVTGNAQSTPYLVEAGYGQCSDNQRDDHNQEQLESREAPAPTRPVRVESGLIH